MNSGELLDAFRSDVADETETYLWSDPEVFRYMSDAYRMFARLTGGIADSVSDLTQLQLVAGEAWTDISPLILRIRGAPYLESTGTSLRLANLEDAKEAAQLINVQTILRDQTIGPVDTMVIGASRNQVRWRCIPAVDDAVRLSVYRLPLEDVAVGDSEFEFDEIGDEHHESLLLWMKHRAYGKQDAETFNRGKRDEFKAGFEEYCAFAKAEGDRLRHKARVVAYGGV